MNNTKRKLVFLSGTRADYGKIKSLIKALEEDPLFEVHIFVTGMHLNKRYGYTANEIEKSGHTNIFKFMNQDIADSMDKILAKTIEGFSLFVRQLSPDLIFVHGDRVEALAGSIVGSLNNIVVGHIEGGEVSGTIDELIRHAVTKLSHLHFVANETAKGRLVQMGEKRDNITIIGSPDLDIMKSESLPTTAQAKKRYDITFDRYAIALYHPVTTEYQFTPAHAAAFVDALIESTDNYVVIYPNNDLGGERIIEEYRRLKTANFLIFPSIRLEYFLSLLKSADYMIGNSSAGIREAPFYGVPSINIGSRQDGRSDERSILHVTNSKEDILNGIETVKSSGEKYKKSTVFGRGDSTSLFLKAIKELCSENISIKKQFIDLP